MNNIQDKSGKQIEILKENMIFQNKIYEAGTNIKDIPEALIPIARKLKKIGRMKVEK